MNCYNIYESADCVSVRDRFKFVDDLTVLEVVNLLTVGISSFNIRGQVPNDLPMHNQFISPGNLQSQDWLNKIEQWTNDQKMLINVKKTKTMIFNYTDKYQFTTRITVNNKNIEVIDSTKLLGTIISNDLKWDQNTAEIVRKANARMALLRKVAEFGAPVDDLKIIYIMYIRSLLEQSATVWHSRLTEENASDLERVQKSAMKVIFQEKFNGYQNCLNKLNLPTLVERREQLCLSFAQKCVKHPKTQELFPLNDKKHNIKIRKSEKYKVQHAHTDRLKFSSVIYMQNLLNQNEDQASR